MAERLSRQASLLVPPLTTDDNYLDLATLVARLQEISLMPLLVYHIDTTERPALSYLADQFHVMGNEGWGFAESDAQKRTVIKNAIELHRYKGTPWAIKTAISQFGFDTTVLDWFRYGGQPYYFRVEIDLYDQGWGQKDSDLVYGLIDQWKNIRSHLDNMAVYQTGFCQAKMASAGLMGEVISVWPSVNRQIEELTKGCLAAGSQLCEVIYLLPKTESSLEAAPYAVSFTAGTLWFEEVSIHPKA